MIICATTIQERWIKEMGLSNYTWVKLVRGNPQISDIALFCHLCGPTQTFQQLMFSCARYNIHIALVYNAFSRSQDSHSTLHSRNFIESSVQTRTRTHCYRKLWIWTSIKRVHDIVVSVNEDRGRCTKWSDNVVARQRGGSAQLLHLKQYFQVTAFKH